MCVMWHVELTQIPKNIQKYPIIFFSYFGQNTASLYDEYTRSF